jgi:cytidine deaminase
MPLFLVHADYPQPPKEGEVYGGSGGVVETYIKEPLPRSFGPELPSGLRGHTRLPLNKG